MIDRQDEIINALILQDRLRPHRITKAYRKRTEPFQYNNMLTRLFREHKKRNPWAYNKQGR